MRWFFFLSTLLLLVIFPIVCQGYLSSQHRLQQYSTQSLHATTEFPSFPFSSVLNPLKFPGIGAKTVTSAAASSASTVKTRSKTVDISLTDAALPWLTSVDPAKKLSYMNLLSHQLSLLRDMGFSETAVDNQFVCRESSVKPARIGNMCFSGGKFRKVRLTYFDAGESVQVFNTLWYPHYEYDLPLLGIDLISLGKNRVLNVIDCQPLYPTRDYAKKHVDFLAPIRAKYPDLHGQLSGKIYDDTSFFSSQMLFGRFTDESKLASVVAPAFKDYLAAYLQHADEAEANHDSQAKAAVEARQAAYDEYSALKDPAVGLFDAYFGKDWSQAFVHDFLFSLSAKQAPSLSNDSSSPQDQHQQQSRAHTFKVDDVTGVVSVQTSSTHAMPHTSTSTAIPQQQQHQPMEAQSHQNHHSQQYSSNNSHHN